MEFVQFVLSFVSVVLLSMTCDGCYTNYVTCYTTFAKVPAPTGSDTSQYCNAANEAVTCLKNDAISCSGSETVPTQYTNNMLAMQNIVKSCTMASCGLRQQECSNKTITAYNIIPKDGSQPPESSLPRFCTDMKSGLDCYANLKTTCPSIADIVDQTSSQFASFLSRYCHDSAGTGSTSDDSGGSATTFSSLIILLVGLFNLL